MKGWQMSLCLYEKSSFISKVSSWLLAEGGLILAHSDQDVELLATLAPCLPAC